MVTPRLRDTILAGITRDSAIELLRNRGILVEERDISIEEVKDAAINGKLREAFATSTALGIRSIDRIRIDQLDLGTSMDSSLSQELAIDLKRIFAGENILGSNGWVRSIGLRGE